MNEDTPTTQSVIVTANVPSTADDAVAVSLVEEFARRAGALEISQVSRDESAGALQVRFLVGILKLNGFCEDLRSIGLTRILVDGSPFVPHLIPANRKPELSAPVSFFKSGRAVPPKRKIVAVHPSSTDLECGHIGLLPPRRNKPGASPSLSIRCLQCLPPVEIAALTGASSNEWLQEAVNASLSEKAG